MTDGHFDGSSGAPRAVQFRTRQSGLRVTLAMAAGPEDRLWSVEESV
jgi:hypothetical protein